MSGYSFYGGKEGRTYNLVAHYDSVEQMINLFSQGGSYIDVNYNEYVIIDTIINNNDKTNPENGIIYRRGLNYTEKGKEAPNINDNRYYETTTETIGQETITTTKFKKEAYETDFKAYIQAPGGGAIYVGQIVGPTGDTPKIELLKWSDFNNKSEEDPDIYDKSSIIVENIVGNDPQIPSGKTHNYIQYGYANIKDTDGNITGVYLSFDFPYTAFEMSAESISPYNTNYGTYNNGEWSYSGLISEKNESQDKNFYYSYDIKIPKGIKGDDIADLDIITPNEEDIENNGFDNKGQWLVYKDRNYNTSSEGAESDWKPLAPYKVISNITANPINENYEHPGKLKVYYTYDEPDTFDLKNVERLEIGLNDDLEPSHLIVQYTDGTKSDLGAIEYVKDLEMDENQIIYYKLSTNSDPNSKSQLGQIIGLNNIEYKDGQLIFTWNYKEEELDEDFKTDVFDLKVLKEIEVINSYNTNIADATEYNQVKDGIPNELKRRVLTAKYEQNDIFNDEELYRINEISDIKLQGDNIIVLYSDPEKRKNINENQVFIDTNGYRWRNLGPILGGNHIQGDFSSFNELKTRYPFGFGFRSENGEKVADESTANRQGWIATVTVESENPEEDNYVELYAYDYNLDENDEEKGWYLIQELGAESVRPEYSMILELPNSQEDNIPQNNDALLNNHGFWFVLENRG